MAVLKDTIIQGDLRVTGTIWGTDSPLYGECSTAAATAAKTVTINNFPGLITGVTIKVKFTNSNTVASPTLNVNGTGAKAIMRYGTTAVSTSAATSWRAGAVVSLTYDGTNWVENTGIDDNTTYSSQTAASGGTATSLVTTGEKYTWNNKQNALTAGTGISISSNTISLDGAEYYSAKTSRTANTVLAAPNGSAGAASFRALVAADIPNLNTSKLTAGTLGVARGGTGAASFTANSAIISGSSTTAALTTRTIRNNTATSGAVTADTALITSNTLRYAINRTTSVAAADTNYTTYMARGQALNTADTNPTVNGAISWTYK